MVQLGISFLQRVGFMYTKKLFFTLASCLLLCSNTHAQDKKEDLVQLACAGNQSALAAIETYYSKCNLTCESPAGIGKKNTEYWRNSALIRIREPHAITTLDVKIEKGKLYSVQIAPNQKADRNMAYTHIYDPNFRILDANPWDYSLFVLPFGLMSDEAPPVFTLTEAVSRSTVRKAEWVGKHPARQIHLILDINGEPRSYEVWVDPSRNWLINRCVMTYRSKNKRKPDAKEVEWKFDWKVTDWTEIKPTLFVPTRSTSVSDTGDDFIITKTAEITNIRINEPISPPAMPHAPAGTLLFDKIENRIYPLGPNGVPQGRGQRVGEPFYPTMPTPDKLNPNPNRVDRSASYRKWLLPILVVVALAGGLFFGSRYLRKA
ncbi:hypothetical protein KIH39_20905 [Telmatocola sphagniphila]|uniref:Uncharacterized protein n=1 Tax=Telmatocola sphagniphila TaxID=1123043 RepID=A0A8E6EUH8_9BACT|nr:hypothetical protein [Telmatocola sphagniphila]QVL31282.1 hypothetical protein KIH39_20905 [Telmatocola sphagniphila]